MEQITEITTCIYKPLVGREFSGVVGSSHNVETVGPRFRIMIVEENMKTVMETIRTIMEELFGESIWKGITPHGLLWVPRAPLGYQKLRVVGIGVDPLVNDGMDFDCAAMSEREGAHYEHRECTVLPSLPAHGQLAGTSQGAILPHSTKYAALVNVLVEQTT